MNLNNIVTHTVAYEQKGDKASRLMYSQSHVIAPESRVIRMDSCTPGVLKSVP